MKRKLVYRDGSSHKFWNIELEGKTFIVTYGRVGTEGRTNSKRFSSVAAAQKEADKLIASKLNKGYAEVGKKSGAAKKPTKASKRPMGDKGVYAPLIQEWKDFAAELRQNPNFAVKARFGKPASERAITRAEKAQGKEFPEALKNFLRTVDGFDIEIREADPALEIFHELSEFPPEHHFMSAKQHAATYKDTLWFDGDDEDEPRRNFVIVDFPQGEFCYGYVLLGKTAANPKITYHYCSDEMRRTRDDLAGYIERCLSDARKLVARAQKRMERKATRPKEFEAPAAFAALREVAELSMVNQMGGGDLERKLPKLDPSEVWEIQLDVKNPRKPFDIEQFTAFENLRDLNLRGLPADSDLSPLKKIKNLQEVSLDLHGARNRKPLSSLRGVVLPMRNRTSRTSKVYIGGLDNFTDWKLLSAFANADEVELRLGKGCAVGDLSIFRKAYLIRIVGEGKTVKLPQKLRVGPKLRWLELRSLGLDLIPRFEGASGLETLELEGNRISDLSGVDRLPKLTSLSLRDNRIGDFGDLPSLPKLRYLYLDRNKLRRIGELDGLKSLTALDLSGNRITGIQGVGRLNELEQLNLVGNSIRRIENLEANNKLQQLQLDENPLQETEGLTSVPKGCWVGLTDCGFAKPDKTAIKKQHGKRLKLSL